MVWREIDIMEQFENKNIITSTIHWFDEDNVDINGTGQVAMEVML